MKTTSRGFSTDVELPCKVFWGSEPRLETSGTAVTIDSGSLALRLLGNGNPYPNVGERVELEVLLPVNFKKARAKCLTFRAEVVQVTEPGDGSRQLEVNFRKATFKDVAESNHPKARKAVTGWEVQ
jgi:hypothetical protein